MGTTHDRIRTTAAGLATALFVVGIWLPLLGLIGGWNPDEGLRERRVLETRPPFEATLESLRTYPARFEAYFNDRFGFREFMIRTNNVVRVVWLGDGPRTRMGRFQEPARGPAAAPHPLSRGVLRGRDSWFYLFTGAMMRDFRGLATYSPETLAETQRALERRRDRLAARGIPYLLVIVPEKYTVYPEHLPENIIRVEEETRADQLVNHLRANSDLDVLDLRPALIGARPEGRLYHRTGAHWNDLGAYVAYREILERLGVQFPALEPLPLAAFERRTQIGPARPLLGIFGLRDRLSDELIELVPRSRRIARAVALADPPPSVVEPPAVARATQRLLDDMETGREDLPRAVMLHDSFTRVGLADFLSEHFERIAYVRGQVLDMELIERERPDVVIEERVERFLGPTQRAAAKAVRP